MIAIAYHVISVHTEGVGTDLSVMLHLVDIFDDKDLQRGQVGVLECIQLSTLMQFGKYRFRT